MFRKKSFILIILLCTVFVSGDLPAYKFDFVTVGDVVKKIKQRFAEIDGYQADFSITSEKLGKKNYQTGTVKYKASNRMLIEFSKPFGQRIVSNGKTMWVYIPSMNVVAEQDLNTDSDPLFFSGSKSGLRRLFSKYHYKFASKDQPEQGADGRKNYTLILQQKETRGGFRSLKLWISEGYMITRAAGETSSGKKVEIEFSNIKTDVSLPNGIFKFEIPANARVIKNPMISEE